MGAECSGVEGKMSVCDLTCEQPEAPSQKKVVTQQKRDESDKGGENPFIQPLFPLQSTSLFFCKSGANDAEMN